MTVQASVSGVKDTVTVGIRIRDKGAWRNRFAVFQMVAVRDARVVTSTTLGLRLLAKQDVWHADGLVDRWGGNSGPFCPNENQRHADDYGENHNCSVHSFERQLRRKKRRRDTPEAHPPPGFRPYAAIPDYLRKT